LTALAEEGSFDLVLLHDVLEHVVDCDAVLAAARDALAAGGKVFVSFPPYRSAFGGHQFLAEGRARFAPFVHYLPAPLFLRLVRPVDNEYMAGSDAIADVVAVRRTRLTLAKAERAFARAGLRIASSEFWVLRPEYGVRYGMATLRAGLLARVPLAREVFVNGAFYLLEVVD
jgi:SAM-dependent methyltransferase